MSNILEIDKKISEWCISISIDKYTGLIDIFSKLTDETFIDNIYNDFIEELKSISTEKDLISDISILIDQADRDYILKHMDKTEISSILDFIHHKYYIGWKMLWDKEQEINDIEYDQCLIELSKNYQMDESTSDVFIGMFLDTRIKI